MPSRPSHSRKSSIGGSAAYYGNPRDRNSISGRIAMAGQSSVVRMFHSATRLPRDKLRPRKAARLKARFDEMFP